LRAAELYLRRLFLQIQAARKTGAFLILGEEDIELLEQVGQYILSKKLPTPFDLPDLRGKLIDPEAFCDGLLNFSPPDIHAIAAVRSDPQIQKYGRKIADLLAEAPSNEREQKIIAAMLEAHLKSEAGAKVEKIFEVGSWVVKPLHYVPLAGEIVSAVEDIKDLGMKWLHREISEQEWFMLSARMTDVAIDDYLRRKANIMPPR
jgi:hypothetical protein